jgi:hypothetical protein
MKARVEFTVDVEIDIPDDLVGQVIGPPVLNLDDEGVSQPDVPGGRGGRGWRDVLYDLRTPEAVLKHIAYGYVFNNEGLDRQEGWLMDLADADRIRMSWDASCSVEFDVSIVAGEETLTPYRNGAEA